MNFNARQYYYFIAYSLINPDKQDGTGGLVETKKRGKFVKGQSGNPAGRPKSGDAVTDLFRKYLGKKEKGDRVTRKQRLVEELYQRALGRTIVDGDGKTVRIPGSDEILKYIVNRLDGMPKQAVDLDALMHSDDSLTVFIGKKPEESDGEKEGCGGVSGA